MIKPSFAMNVALIEPIALNQRNDRRPGNIPAYVHWLPLERAIV
jgi:hypothetical protein